MDFTLSSASLKATVRTRGGELVSLRDQAGTEYIWQGDPAFWAGQNPILFPIVGSLKDGRVDIGGKTCEMGRHGFARGSEFAPVEQGEDFVTLELRESGDTLARYPFPFSLKITHRLLEDGFSTALTVKNTGAAPMPFCVGAHTAIRCPLQPGERFEDYQLLFDRGEDAVPLCPTADGLLSREGTGPALSGRSIPLTHAPFDELDTLIFQDLRSTGVALVHQGTGRGVHMDFAGFPMVAFWTPSNANAPFLCLEPWQGCAAYVDEDGEFLHKPGCAVLLPGERKTLAYTVRTV